jgi:hypothetical protein
VFVLGRRFDRFIIFARSQTNKQSPTIFIRCVTSKEMQECHKLLRAQNITRHKKSVLKCSFINARCHCTSAYAFSALKDSLFKTNFSGTRRYCVIPGQLSVLCLKLANMPRLSMSESKILKGSRLCSQLHIHFHKY